MPFDHAVVFKNGIFPMSEAYKQTQHTWLGWNSSVQPFPPAHVLIILSLCVTFVWFPPLANKLCFHSSVSTYCWFTCKLYGKTKYFCGTELFFFLFFFLTWPSLHLSWRAERQDCNIYELLVQRLHHSLLIIEQILWQHDSTNLWLPMICFDWLLYLH